MIEIVNLKKRYKNKEIFTNLNYNLKNNGLYFIFNESGSGKTTLFNMMYGLDKDYKGNIICDKKNIFYMMQKPFLIVNKTVIENIDIVVNNNYDKEISNKLFNYLNIESILNFYPREISYGQMQRVFIACSILSDKKILLLDEPLSGLDKDNKFKVLELLKKESNNRVIIISCHDKLLAKMYANYFIDLYNSDITTNKKKDIKTNEYYEKINDNTDIEINEDIKYYNIKNNNKKNNIIFKISIMLIVLLIVMLSIFTNYHSPEKYVKNVNSNLIQIDTTYFYEENYDKIKSILTDDTLYLSFNDFDDNLIDKELFNDDFYYEMYPLSLLNEDDIIYGNYPANKNEVIIDINLYNNFIKLNRQASTISSGISNYKDLVGEMISYKNYYFYISGITNKNSNSIYFFEECFLGSSVSYLDNYNYSLIDGEIKDNKNYVIVSKSFLESNELSIGDNFDGLYISGVFESEGDADILISYKNFLRSFVFGNDDFITINIISKDLDKTIDVLERYSISYSKYYDKVLESYYIRNQKIDNYKIIIIINLIILLVTLFLYFRDYYLKNKIKYYLLMFLKNYKLFFKEVINKIFQILKYYFVFSLIFIIIYYLIPFYIRNNINIFINKEYYYLLIINFVILLLYLISITIFYFNKKKLYKYIR